MGDAGQGVLSMLRAEREAREALAARVATLEAAQGAYRLGHRFDQTISQPGIPQLVPQDGPKPAETPPPPAPTELSVQDSASMRRQRALRTSPAPTDGESERLRKALREIASIGERHTDSATGRRISDFREALDVVRRALGGEAMQDEPENIYFKTLEEGMRAERERRAALAERVASLRAAKAAPPSPALTDAEALARELCMAHIGSGALASDYDDATEGEKSDWRRAASHVLAREAKLRAERDAARELHRGLLAVLASRHPARFTRAQLGTLAGLAHSGGTFSTYLSRLRSGGLLEEDGELIGCSPEGLDAVGTVPTAPSSPEEIQAVWRRAVGEGAAGRVLDALVAFYPGWTSRERLAAEVGLTAGAGTFSTYLSRLRSNGLLEERGHELRASPVLMGEA